MQLQAENMQKQYLYVLPNATSSPNPVSPPVTGPYAPSPSGPASTIHKHIHCMEAALSQILQCITNGPGPAEPLAYMTTPPLPFMDDVSTDMAMVVNRDDQAASISSKALEVCDIQLGNRKVIDITEDDVPNPTALTFAHDIAHLNCIWDDTSGFWDGSKAAFAINGERIALMHWPVLYGRWKGLQWEGLKKLFSEWKVYYLSMSMHHWHLLILVSVSCQLLPQQEPWQLLEGVLHSRWHALVLFQHQSDVARAPEEPEFSHCPAGTRGVWFPV